MKFELKYLKRGLKILIFSLSINIYGQNDKKILIPFSENGDTSYWYLNRYERYKKLNLTNIETNTDDFHFRLWLNGQIVEIWTQDNKTFFGALINYIDSNERFDIKKQKTNTYKTFSNQVQLDTSIARQTYILYKTINSIPTEDSIIEWKSGLDGITYVFEISTPTFYSFKSYWTPSIQDSNLIEAKQIQKFIDEINQILNLDVEYDKFFSTLKPGCYTINHCLIMTKLSQEQIDFILENKPYMDYLNSVKDTLNNYLSDTLTKILNKYGDLKCNNIKFLLVFSEKNKLIKITTNNDLHDFMEKILFYKCRRKIKKAFKLIKVDFVHSKIVYWKELHYMDKKVKIIN